MAIKVMPHQPLSSEDVKPKFFDLDAMVVLWDLKEFLIVYTKLILLHLQNVCIRLHSLCVLNINDQ